MATQGRPGGGDDQERNEAPTPKRRDEARKEGRVPRSLELSGAVTLLAAAPALAAAGGGVMARELTGFLRAATRQLAAGPLGAGDAVALLQLAGRAFLLAVLAPVGVVLLASTAVGLVQGRGVVTAERLKPNFGALDPVAGFGRIFSLQAVAQLVRALVKLAVLGTVAYVALRDAWPAVLAAGDAGPAGVVTLVRTLGQTLAVRTGLAFLALAAADYGYEVWQYEKGLRMSRSEVQQEQKETDGNPLVKSRIRSLMQSMARKRMLSDVKKADVVVTNPTHIAIALRYDPAAGGAPVVLAMGERKLAERIKAIAKAAGIPMVENRPLARAMLATCKVGKPIPVDLYTAVAEVLAYVYRRRGWRPA